jgi:hypothetical protein
MTNRPSFEFQAEPDNHDGLLALLEHLGQFLIYDD